MCLTTSIYDMYSWLTSPHLFNDDLCCMRIAHHLVFGVQQYEGNESEDKVRIKGIDTV